MAKISEIFLKYDTDKVKKNGVGHSYGEFYDYLFSKFGEQIDLLEIGVYWGGSLLAWKEFLPKSNIYGLDIVDIRKSQYVSNEVNFILSDAKNIDKIKDLKFDLIIDDGSHYLDDVVFVVQNYLSLLKPKGILVIEDVQDGQTWSAKIESILPAEYKFEVWDLRPQGQYDDFLIIITKNDL